MDVWSFYKQARDEVSREPVAHAVVAGVFVALNVLSGGLGVLLLPNYLRELRAAEAEQRLPDTARLFDTSRLNSDVTNGLIYLAAVLLGSWACGVGASAAALLLGLQMPLAATDRYEPLDNAKLSARHALDHLQDHVRFFGVAVLLVTASLLLCGLPLLVVLPVLSLAQNHFFDAVQSDLDALAEREGIVARPVLPDSPEDS